MLYPNPRGSFGQGEKFTQANVKDFGYGDFQDILKGVDEVVKTLPVDNNRIGITGWSYGGYMTMWAVTQTNRFRAAVAGAGLANWQSYYGQNDIDEWMPPYFGATVYDDPAIYARSAPITFIKNVKTPTLVLVGQYDGECPMPAIPRILVGPQDARRENATGHLSRRGARIPPTRTPARRNRSSDRMVRPLFKVMEDGRLARRRPRSATQCKLSPCPRIPHLRPSKELFSARENPPAHHLVAFSDGGARGNPGPSGYGVVIQDEAGRKVAALSEYLGPSDQQCCRVSRTNRRARVCRGNGHKALKVISDSELLVRQIKGIYKVKNAALQDLHGRAKELIAQLEWFSIGHVLRGHNEEADGLANAAMDKGTGRVARAPSPAALSGNAGKCDAQFAIAAGRTRLRVLVCVVQIIVLTRQRDSDEGGVEVRGKGNVIATFVIPAIAGKSETSTNSG